MNKKNWPTFLRSITLLSAVVFFGPKVHALTALNGILYGEIKEDADNVDPLEYVFQLSQHPSTQGKVQYLERLNHYIGTYREGENLRSYCEKRPKVDYGSEWDLMQAKRGTLATLQFLGLDLTTRAIAKYAQELKFTSEEFKNLTERLTQNYCSKNLSILSLRQLRHNLERKFGKNPEFELPSTVGGVYFSELLNSYQTSETALEHGLILTVKLFRAFCSWGGEAHNYRLLVPLVKSPYIMSLVARQMDQKKIVWDQKKNQLHLEHDEKTVRVSCHHLVCRKSEKAEFFKNFPLSIGSASVSKDVMGLYCEHFRHASYPSKDEKHIMTWIQEQSFNDDFLMVGHMISLVTGIPQFMAQTENFQDSLAIYRSSIDEYWSKWAVYSNKEYSRDLFYEESLTIEKANRQFYFSPNEAKFKVVFDVNLGELDRVYQIRSKVASVHLFKLHKSFLSWIRREWLLLDMRKKEKKEHLINVLKAQIVPQLEKIRKTYIVPPWEGDLARIVALELLEQLALYQGKFFLGSEQKIVEIPIEFRYAPFALKYIHYRFRSERGQAEIDL